MTPIRFDTRRYLSLAVVALSGLATVALAASGIGWLVEARSVARLSDDAVDKPQPPAPPAAPPNAPATPMGFPGTPAPGPGQEIVQAIIKRNIFSPPMPPMQLTAVLGAKAYFSNGMSGVAGTNLGTMKVIEVGTNWAKVEMEGREQQMYVFGPSSLGGAGMGGLRPGFQLPPGVQLPEGPGGAGGTKAPRPTRPSRPQ